MEFAFELSTRKNSGRAYLFAAESLEDRMTWMAKLAQVVVIAVSVCQSYVSFCN
jgi:hypothetical protein